MLLFGPCFMYVWVSCDTHTHMHVHIVLLCVHVCTCGIFVLLSCNTVKQSSWPQYVVLWMYGSSSSLTTKWQQCLETCYMSWDATLLQHIDMQQNSSSSSHSYVARNSSTKHKWSQSLTLQQSYSSKGYDLCFKQQEMWVFGSDRYCTLDINYFLHQQLRVWLICSIIASTLQGSTSLSQY